MVFHDDRESLRDYFSMIGKVSESIFRYQELLREYFSTLSESISRQSMNDSEILFPSIEKQ